MMFTRKTRPTTIGVPITIALDGDQSTFQEKTVSALTHINPPRVKITVYVAVNNRKAFQSASIC